MESLADWNSIEGMVQNILSIMAILTLAAKLTPTQRDDNALEIIRQVVEWLGAPVPDLQQRKSRN